MPEDGASPLRACRSRAASRAARSARRVAPTFQRSTAMCDTATRTRYARPGAPKASTAGTRHSATCAPCTASAAQPRRPEVPLLSAIQSSWRTKSATRWASTSHARTSTVSVTSGPRPRAPAGAPPTAATPSAKIEARPRASCPRWRIRPRLAITLTVARLTWRRSAASARSVAVHEQQAANLALAAGELVEQGGEHRAQVGEQLVRGRVARLGDEAHATGPGLVENGARAEEHRPRALGRRSLAGLGAARDHGPAQASGVRPQGGMQDRRERVGRRHEQELDLVALGEPGGRQPLCPIRGLEVVTQVAQERRGARVLPGIDDVAEERRGGQQGCHAGEPTAS